VKSYKISDARDNFATIVKQAEAGEQILLTRHGKAVVSIQPVESDIPAPGFLAKAGWSVEIAPDFDSLPRGFEEYT
jgi:prevent-host-death family protein